MERYDGGEKLDLDAELNRLKNEMAQWRNEESEATTGDSGFSADSETVMKIRKMVGRLPKRHV
jgi:hypothetical protein